MPRRGGVNERKPGWAKRSNPRRTRGCRNGGKHSRSFRQCRPSRGGKRRGSSAVASSKPGSNRRGSLQPPAGRGGDNECSGAFEEGSSRSREPFARGGPTRRHAPRIVQGRPWAARGARGGKPPRQQRGGSLGAVGYPVASRSFGRRRRERLRKRAGLASRDRESGSGAGEDRTLVGRARASFKCVAEVDGRCPDPEKRERGSFLTKFRARVTGDLALPFSRGVTAPSSRGAAPKATARERASRTGSRWQSREIGKRRSP